MKIKARNASRTAPPMMQITIVLKVFISISLKVPSAYTPDGGEFNMLPLSVDQ